MSKGIHSRRSSVDLTAGVGSRAHSRRPSIDLGLGAGHLSRRASVDYSASGLGAIGLPRQTTVDVGHVGTVSRRNSVDYSAGVQPRSPSYGRDLGTSGYSSGRRYGSSYDTGTSRGYGNTRYGGSSGYGGGSGLGYLNSSSHGTSAAKPSYSRSSSYEPRYSYGGSGGPSGSVMDRVKKFGSTPEPRSYTPLTSRRSSVQRDYGGGGGNTGDKYSSRSGGSDYSSNKSGHNISDYGGSNQSLYNSWDRKSSISGGRYGQQSRETSPVNVRAPPQHRQYDYSSSASPSPYSTYRSSSDAQSPAIQRKYERQSSRSSDIYEEPSRPRRRWEDDVYGSGKLGVSETLREPVKPVKPPPKDYSDSESDDSAPEDDKGHRLRYMTSRGTSPMREPDKREHRTRKDSSSGIAKVKRVRCPQKDSRVRSSRSDIRRKRLVDCGIQTNLDESPPPRRRRGDGLGGSSRDDIAKLAALALLKDDGGDAGGRESYENYRDKFEQAAPPATSNQKKQQTHQAYGSNLQKQNRNEAPSRREPEYDDSVLDQPSEKSWRKSVYGNQTSNRESSYDDNVLNVPDEKSWRKAVYDDPSPSPPVSPALRRHQTQEDLRVSPNEPQSRQQTKTSTPIPNHEYDAPAEEHMPSKPERRSYTSADGEKRHSRQSDSDNRRSKHESDQTSKFRRSSSRDSMLDERPRRNRQRTSSRELLDEPESKPRAPPLTPDSLSLRDSIEKVHNWKQNLPPSVDTHLSVDTGHSKHPEIGFARSDDSGEYFSAQEHHQSSGRSSREPEVKYKDTMYAQRSPTSPVKRRETVETTDDEVLSPTGARRRHNRKQLSRELSTDNVFDEDEFEDRSHHPILKTYRKSDLNRSVDLERRDKEELERRQRIYSGVDEPGNGPPRTEIHKRSGSSSDAFSRDESPNRRRGYGKRGSSRSSSRELLDERRPRKIKSEVDQLTSDSSTFGFNREGSPNRPSSRSKRPSRPSSRENVLDENDVQTYQDSQYIRPHSMVVSNESLANLSAAGSIASMNSAMMDDGTLRNSTSMQSMISNEIKEQPPPEHFPQSNFQKSLDSSGSGSPLPDIVPDDKDGKLSKKNKTNAGFIGGTQDIDNLLNFSPNEEEFVEKGKQPVDDVIKQTRPHLLDAPVPRQPSPIKPLHAEDEKLIDIDEPPVVSPVMSPHQEPPTRDKMQVLKDTRVTTPEQRITSPQPDPRMLSPSPDPRLTMMSPEPRMLTPSPDPRPSSSRSDSRMTTPSSESRMSSQTPDSSRKTSSPLYSRISSPMPDSRVNSPAQDHRHKAKVDPNDTSGASDMWDHLNTHKGLVVIGDILGFCNKPKKSRFIRIPGVEEESDKRFRGYDTANELLDNMQVDTKKLEDCALQIYRYHHGAQGDYGTYLDLESTIDEQSEDLEGFQDQRKNALILRTQLTVRVHAVIEKLLNSSGRELRRALFSLKQIFQDDKDLVHEFVNNDGLECLIKVGAEADQNYQNYILRALGQVMLYVDGMNGVINHNETVQWLYSLLSSKVETLTDMIVDIKEVIRDIGLYSISRFRLVVKTALKLLLVFVEYTETNTQHLIRAINAIDNKRMVMPWTNIMMILDEKDGGDSELLVYAMTLVNKVVNAIPDQDTFYDVADAMEELGMERITYRHMNRKGADLDLLTQFQTYEAALRAEDGEEDDIGQLENLRRTPRVEE